MLCCVVLCCAVLSVLCCVVSCHVMSNHIILYHIMSNHIISYYIIKKNIYIYTYITMEPMEKPWTDQQCDTLQFNWLWNENHNYKRYPDRCYNLKFSHFSRLSPCSMAWPGDQLYLEGCAISDIRPKLILNSKLAKSQPSIVSISVV